MSVIRKDVRITFVDRRTFSNQPFSTISITFSAVSSARFSSGSARNFCVGDVLPANFGRSSTSGFSRARSPGALIIAAIAAAVASLEGEGAVIRGIRRIAAPAAKSRRGAWGDAGVREHTTPFM